MRGRLLGALLGTALVGLSLWIVGLDDRVTDASGTTYRGRLVDSKGAIVLRTADGERTFEPQVVRSVRAGLLSAFRPLAARPWIALPGLLAHLLAILTVHLRWGVLLRAVGIAMPFRAVLRLGWIGQFAASVLPGGLATGDVAKALYAAKRGDGRGHAVMSVVFDRLLGLVVLCSVALVGALLAPGATRVGATRPILAALLFGGLLMTGFFLSPWFQRVLGLGRVVPRRFAAVALEAGEALALYAGKHRAVALAVLAAVASQSFVLLALFLYGKALGVTMSLFAVLAALPVAQMVSAVPGLPGGFGVGDLAFVALLPDAGVPAGSALALSFTFKTIHVLVSLPAGFWLNKKVPGTLQQSLP